MKRFLFIAGFLIFAVTIFAGPQYAADPPITPSTTPTQMAAKNDYLMAYPGILPDNPLYKIKVLRDKILESLITDPQKKVQFYLLQTDKQLGMAWLLANKKEIDLAGVTALKGENNFTNLVMVYRVNNIKPDPTTYKKLLKAADKHQEVLTNIIKLVGPGNAKTFQQVYNFSKTNVDELTKVYTMQQ